MKVEEPIQFEKRQTKANDCWYACIQMIRSWKTGVKTKPAGHNTVAHRDLVFFGHTLSFGSSKGAAVMKENSLKDVANSITFSKIKTLHTVITSNGPLICGGMFGPFNAVGHFIVIAGVDTDTGECVVYDPGWGKGKEVRQWSSIAKYAFKMVGDDDKPKAGAFVANA